MAYTKRTIVALVQHKPGVLARIATLFRRRGFNIDSLAVGLSERQGFARMTFVVEGDVGAVIHAATQLERLIDVVEVQDVTERNFVWRELALIKVEINEQTRSEILEIGQVFSAKVVDMGAKALTFESAGGRTKADALIGLLRKFGILEIVRTGRVATLRIAVDANGNDGQFFDDRSADPGEEYGHGSV